MNEQMNKENICTVRADTYTALIASCTDQIEDYEKRNYGECMTCIAFVGALLTVIGAVLVISSSGAQGIDTENLNAFIACLFILILPVITIFLYNFAMNCRRSAILRGYMQFLEERLNETLHETSMLYHSVLFSEEIERFRVNRYGPFALAGALLGIYGFSILGSLFFACKIPDGLVLTSYKVLFGFIVLICTFFTVFFGIALIRNTYAVKRSKAICDHKYENSLTRRNI